MTHPSEHDIGIVFDAAGIPTGVADFTALGKTATRLVFELILCTDDQSGVRDALSQLRQELKPDVFAHVASVALEGMTLHVLERVLTACDIAGMDLRSILKKHAHTYLDQQP
ncbi:hypothetical protein [Prescottella equi]